MPKESSMTVLQSRKMSYTCCVFQGRRHAGDTKNIKIIDNTCRTVNIIYKRDFLKTN